MIVNILIGIAIIYGGFQYGLSINKKLIASRNYINVPAIVSEEKYNSSCRGTSGHGGGGVWLIICGFETYEEYKNSQEIIKDYVAQRNKSEYKNTIRLNFDNLVWALLVVLIGFSVIASAIAFQKNNKWGAVVLVILNFLVLVYLGYWGFMALMVMGSVSVLGLSLILLFWLIFEIRYIKQHWAEFN